MSYQYNVFGDLISINREGNLWVGHWVEAEAMQRRAALAVPSRVTHEELKQYLYHYYLDAATPSNSNVCEVVVGQMD